jgi:hypothetical protein
MEPDKEVVEYMKDDVLLLVESIDNSMVITHANLTPEDTYHLTTYLVDRLGKMVGQKYNQVLDDLKEVEDD